MTEHTELALVRRHEGLRLVAYRDTRGNWTIGFGTRITDQALLAGLDAGGSLSIDEAMAEAMLDRGVRVARNQAIDWLSYRRDVWTSARLAAVTSMAYNLGGAGLLQFRMMQHAALAHDWEGVADEALDSQWAQQVGSRAVEIAEMLRTNEWPATMRAGE